MLLGVLPRHRGVHVDPAIFDFMVLDVDIPPPDIPKLRLFLRIRSAEDLTLVGDMASHVPSGIMVEQEVANRHVSRYIRELIRVPIYTVVRRLPAYIEDGAVFTPSNYRPISRETFIMVDKRTLLPALLAYWGIARGIIVEGLDSADTARLAHTRFEFRNPTCSRACAKLCGATDCPFCRLLLIVCDAATYTPVEVF